MGKKMHRAWAYVYDTQIEDMPMIAVSDRLLRRWKRDVAGLKTTIIHHTAEDMGVSLKEAERIIDLFLTERKEHMKRKD